MINNKTWLAMMFLFLNHTALANNDLQMTGTEEHTIMLEKANNTLSANKAKIQKHIQLPHIELSREAQHILNTRLREIEKNTLKLSASELKHIQLGMSKVPVLDQGPFGTCVTFAITAAFDAVLDKGDYISQLCSLQLGNYLKTQGYPYSGWNGSWSKNVFQQIDAFGVINLNNQTKYGCGGLKSYPSSGVPKSKMSSEEYAQYSEDLIHNKISWDPILENTQFVNKINDSNIILKNVKEALNQGNRVTFATFLPKTELGTVGATGWHHYSNDSWIITSPIKNDIKTKKTFAAHAMIITGYDDDAVALDSFLNTHRGLLTLRNSWGSSIGDDGDFYMSYDYFKALVIEANRISPITSS